MIDSTEREYEVRCDLCGVDTHIIVEDGEDEAPVYCPMCGADALEVNELLD